MQYLLLIYANEAEADKMRETGMKEMMDAYRSFTQSIIQAGNFKAGDALQRTTNATTVRVRNGKTMTTDGPFAGYYLIEAKDLDEATSIAARVPSAKFGSIEVRPIMVYS
jgi:hypothetical protein